MAKSQQSHIFHTCLFYAFTRPLKNTVKSVGVGFSLSNFSCLKLKCLFKGILSTQRDTSREQFIPWISDTDLRIRQLAVWRCLFLLGIGVYLYCRTLQSCSLAHSLMSPEKYWGSWGSPPPAHGLRFFCRNSQGMQRDSKTSNFTQKCSWVTASSEDEDH